MNGIRFLVGVVVIAAAVLAARHFGIVQYLTIENMVMLNEWIAGFGVLGPVMFVMLWMMACLLFLPGVAVGILGGVAFGPVWGTVYSSVGSTAGATLSFLVARYVARGMIESWIAHSAYFKQIDEGFERQGWRILVATRLIPFFPFNLQNFGFGLTRISLPVYTTLSWLCMLPSTIALSFTGGALICNDLKRNLIILGIVALCLLLVSLIAGWTRKRWSGNILG